MPAIDSVLAAAARTFDYGNRLLAGIQPHRFARLAAPGGVTIHSNHPAFVFGHLALYPAIVLRSCALDHAPAADAAAPPSDFERLFGRRVPCRDDPAGTIYPPMDAIVSSYQRAWRAGLDALRALPDDTWTQPNRDEARNQTFTTVGFAAVFLLCNHSAVHLGQVSAWRRMEGLGPA
ncbi:MAG: DinB family protein [Phycisphaerae bacterium]|nr:DinB family protein [Phycisphaerae bacterium]